MEKRWRVLLKSQSFAQQKQTQSNLRGVGTLLETPARSCVSDNFNFVKSCDSRVPTGTPRSSTTTIIDPMAFERI